MRAVASIGQADWQTDAMGLFTREQARLELDGLRPVLDELVVVRADVVELSAALTEGGSPTTLGGLPEWKAAEARLNELMTEVQQSGVELKGIAPLLLDFPADLGFAGRRRLP